ncbi:diaminobutyrate acetyltransferase [Veronia nyctiphanis]|uniref:L-2,4-diaminobutyric acid acetyltransferase n=1 Tax=Veronia nyctiphanis TaxID=1278244 RepID=A0A4Q0YQM5_9GAMM|nr:diaminobutyrate acetyltransferase [Veronia nyctiphanis]RXJ72885.1 diaminobutyrate acetyltransferase [Veronia nyctiphanis]
MELLHCHDSRKPISESGDTLTFRIPERQDGIDIHDLIAKCPPLDENSSYCNFLQSHHFNQTCLLAEDNGVIAGFISAYIKPQTANELFVWQVAVSPTMRGRGLASTMLDRLLEREHLSKIDVVETTITKTNKASWRLFEKLDERHGRNGEVSIFLDEEMHFKGRHDTEHLYRIPLNSSL